MSQLTTKDDARHFLTKLVTTVLGMTGWRIDRLNPPWIVAGAASFALAQHVIHVNTARWTAAYFVCMLLFRYLGASLVLSSRAIPQFLLGTFGEARTLKITDTLFGLMFFNHALGLWAMANLNDQMRYLSFGTTAIVFGVVSMIVGLCCKVWATFLVGVDAYYYHDLVLGRSVGSLVRSGPYRFLRNPMYSIGQLHTYGYALVMGSPMGLIAAASCHLMVYAFYFTIEKPFVIRYIVNRDPFTLLGADEARRG